MVECKRISPVLKREGGQTVLDMQFFHFVCVLVEYRLKALFPCTVQYLYHSHWGLTLGITPKVRPSHWE